MPDFCRCLQHAFRQGGNLIPSQTKYRLFPFRQKRKTGGERGAFDEGGNDPDAPGAVDQSEEETTG